MSRFVEYIIDLVVKHPKQCFFTSLVFFFALIPGLGLLQEEYDIRQWLKESDPFRSRLERFENQFGSEDSLVIVVHDDSGIFNLKTAQILNDMTKEAWQLPMVAKVESLVNYNHIGTYDDDIVITPFLERNDFPIRREQTKKYFAEKNEKPWNIMFCRVIW